MVLSLPVKTYAICSAALYFKFFAVSFIQGRKSFLTGNRAPEDGKLTCIVARGGPCNPNFGIDSDKAKSKDDEDKYAKLKETEERWRRVTQNNLESIPFALAVFAGGILTESNPMVCSGLMVLYTVSRFGFTLSYIYGLQPHRAICYMTGVLSIIASSVNAVMAALQH